MPARMETDPVFETEGVSEDELADALAALDAGAVGADPAGTAIATVAAHAADGTAVHGIPDTALLADQDDITAAKARVNHTGSQAISTVTGLQGALDSKADDGDVTAEALAREDGDAAEAIARADAIDAAVATLLGSAPQASLDTLRELGDAIDAGDDALADLIAGKQASSAVLTALAALTPTTFGKAALEWANAAAGIAALGLGTAATRDIASSGDASATQVVKGNDSRLSDVRPPSDGSVTAAKVNAALKPTGSAATTDEALRALGHGAGQALAGIELGLPLALTGATAPTRYVGATAGGAPVSGTFAVGDFVIDNANGYLWICTTAGTPGTWARAGASTLLGSAQLTSPLSTTNTTPTYADAAGLAITVPVTARPIQIKAWFPYVYHSAATQGVNLAIRESTTVLNYALPVGSGASEAQGGVSVETPPLTPSVGNHTYKVSFAGSGAGTSNIYSDANAKAWIMAMEL